MQREKIVFLDRDGTLCRDKGYTVRPEDMAIFAEAGHAVAKLVGAGYRTVMVTNQSAIGRGLASADDVERTNAECLRQLAAEDPGAVISAVRYCPHHPDDCCDCRKPRTGMVHAADFPWAFNAAECWMVGDKLIDLEFGAALGIPVSRCLLVLTGDGESERGRADAKFGGQVPVVEDLCAAADFIVR